MEHSAPTDSSRSPDVQIFRRGFNQEMINDDARSRSFQKGPVCQETGDARIKTKNVDDDSCRDAAEFERLSKYPDYCRTITIRGAVYFPNII